MENEKLIDEWWERFEETDPVEGRIGLIKEVGDLKKPKEFYKSLEIGDAIFEHIEPSFKENLSGYCSFLEALKDNYPIIFDLEAVWFVRWMIKYYIFCGKNNKIGSLVDYLVKNPKDDPDIIFDILDLLIINEDIDNAWKLFTNYYVFFNDSKSIIPSGMDELSVLGGVFIVSREKEENIKKELKRYNYQQKENILMERVKILRKKEYVNKAWKKEDFQGKEKMLNLYFLSLEFARALKKKYNLVTAHYLQHALYDYYYEMGMDNFVFNEQKTDELLATYAGMTSLSQTKAFVILCSIKLFYDFLKANSLIEGETYHDSLVGINNLSDSLHKAFEKDIWKYKFAEGIIRN
ncbi:MAG: hypothetical protein ABH840_02295 [Nanoarchaeota archaeon]